LEKGGKNVMVVLGWYGTQRQGAELVNFDNQLVPQEHPVWRKPTEVERNLAIGSERLELREARVDAPSLGQRMLVWYWNRAGGQSTTSALGLKLALGLRKLSGQGDPGAVIIIAAPYQDRPETAEATLRSFVADLLPGLNPVLDQAGK
jgi:EpsI family protein